MTCHKARQTRGSEQAEPCELCWTRKSAPGLVSYEVYERA